MAKIGIYGGSFNPIHYGHIGLAQWVANNTDIDRVWLVVTPNNPLKESKMLADEQQRLNNAKQAVKNIQGVEVSDVEFKLTRPSYTANTLRELQKAYPEHQFALVIGQDNWQIRSKWREWDYIEANYPIYIYPRQGCIAIDIDSLPPTAQYLSNAPYFNVSSTQIRKQQNRIINNKNKIDMTRTTFNRLRDVKDSLPHGSMDKIASELGISADEVRAYFNGQGAAESGYHIEPGPDGGIVMLGDTRILEIALRIAWEDKNNL